MLAYRFRVYAGIAKLYAGIAMLCAGIAIAYAGISMLYAGMAMLYAGIPMLYAGIPMGCAAKNSTCNCISAAQLISNLTAVKYCNEDFNRKQFSKLE
jgi:hypothetical protein